MPNSLVLTTQETAWNTETNVGFNYNKQCFSFTDRSLSIVASLVTLVHLCLWCSCLMTPVFMMAMTHVFNVGKILLPLFCDPDVKNASRSQT